MTESEVLYMTEITSRSSYRPCTIPLAKCSIHSIFLYICRNSKILLLLTKYEFWTAPMRPIHFRSSYYLTQSHSNFTQVNNHIKTHQCSRHKVHRPCCVHVYHRKQSPSSTPVSHLLKNHFTNMCTIIFGMGEYKVAV